MTDTYLGQSRCYNCDYANYPQWGEFEKGKLISDYPCPKCGCMTLHPDRGSDVVSESA